MFEKILTSARTYPGVPVARRRKAVMRYVTHHDVPTLGILGYIVHKLHS